MYMTSPFKGLAGTKTDLIYYAVGFWHFLAYEAVAVFERYQLFDLIYSFYPL